MFKPITAAAIALGLMALCEQSYAQESAKPEEDPAAGSESKPNVEKKKLDSKPKKADPKTAKAAPAKKQFVDRDGDGICDGKEHRFRSQKKRKKGRAKSRSQGEIRLLERRGKDYGKAPDNKAGPAKKAPH